MYLIFPTTVHQSISVAYSGRSPDVLAIIEEPVRSRVVLPNGQSGETHWRHVASERLDFNYAVRLQMMLNERRGVEDARFGQKAKSRIILPH